MCVTVSTRRRLFDRLLVVRPCPRPRTGNTRKVLLTLWLICLLSNRNVFRCRPLLIARSAKTRCFLGDRVRFSCSCPQVGIDISGLFWKATALLAIGRMFERYCNSAAPFVLPVFIMAMTLFDRIRRLTLRSILTCLQCECSFLIASTPGF